MKVVIMFKNGKTRTFSSMEEARPHILPEMCKRHIKIEGKSSILYLPHDPWQGTTETSHMDYLR